MTYVIIEHNNGKIEDISFEMLGKARAMGNGVTAILLGSGTGDMVAQLGAADKVIVCDDPAFANFNPEAACKTASSILSGNTGDVILVGNTSMGMEIGPGLSASLGIPLVAYVTDIADGTVTSSLYGGKMSVQSAVSGGYIASVMAGAFPGDDGRVDGSPATEAATACVTSDLKVRFKQLIAPEGGDVDITQQDVLVSVGRGIQNEDNLEIVEELAQKLNAAVSCSRPIVDNKWLPKSRQVGKSGLKVKPKVYLAIGISGAPEHIEGMRDADTIIAINTDENAPIFDYADYGTTEDLFDVVPAITEKL